MNFQKIVYIIATIVLVIILCIIGYTMSKSSKENEQWPPVIGNCPDYWVDASENGSECVNTHRLGTCNLPGTGTDKNSMNFNIAPFNSSDGDCAKYKWAKQCKVTWDGITSGVSNPCNTTTTS